MTRMVTKRLKKRKRHEPFPFADMVMFMINGQASSGEDVDGGDLGETPYPAEEGYPSVHSCERSPCPSSLDGLPEMGFVTQGAVRVSLGASGSCPWHDQELLFDT